MTDFNDSFEVVFVDSSGLLNLFADITTTAFQQVSNRI